MLEIWTRRTIYRIDAGLQCIQVADRLTGRALSAHRCIGTRLGGGRHTQGSSVTVTFPLPLPGARAFFEPFDESGAPAIVTGTIERVVVQTQEVALEEATQNDAKRPERRG